MKLTPIVELGVAEAYAILRDLGVTDLPPLDAIENEDWGRDSLLATVRVDPPATWQPRPDSRRGVGLDRTSAAPGTDDA